MDSSTQVTAVIIHRVRPGREAGYEAWSQGIALDARSFRGYLGAHILRPELGVTPDYTIVVQFDTGQHLDEWMQSNTRRDWIERVKPLVLEPESIRTITGLEPWFHLPQQSQSLSPKRYKQAILVWIGVASIALTLSPHVMALLNSWPWILRVFINMGITVVLLTYWVMPTLTRCFRPWLLRP